MDHRRTGILPESAIDVEVAGMPQGKREMAREGLERDGCGYGSVTGGWPDAGLDGDGEECRVVELRGGSGRRSEAEEEGEDRGRGFSDMG